MTEREKLEAIMKDGDCGRVNCREEEGNCPFVTIVGCSVNRQDMINHAKAMLAELDNEWKPLEVDNLPSDILTWTNESHNLEVWNKSHDEWNEVRCLGDGTNYLIVSYLEEGYKYRYRKRQPTVEDMADKFIADNATYVPDAVINSYAVSKKIMKQRRDAYIAGYKAAKDE